MSLKPVDPNDTYVVRELFACGDGHFLTPGFTHWEAGECCPHGGHVNDPHLYYRNVMVPTRRSKRQGGGNMWKYLLKNPGKWGHLPLAKQ